MNINDWSAIQTLFDKLNKQVEKAQKTTNTLGSPRIYIRMLVELEVKVLDNHMSALLTLCQACSAPQQICWSVD